MGNEYRAKVFKSGNSVALRLPKALGFEEGTEVVMRETDAGLAIERAPAPRRFIDLTGIAGSIPGLRPRTREERDFDDAPRAWDMLGPCS